MSSQRLWLGFGAIALVSFVVQVALPVDPSDRPETSWDTAPRGHAAFLELLERFDATRGRWLTGVSMPDPEESLWLIAPSGVCGAAGPAGSDDGQALREPFRFVVVPWIEAGGTAVVWLSHPPVADDEGTRRAQPEAGPGDVRDGWQEDLSEAWRTLRQGRARRCAAIAGHRLPPRTLVGAVDGEAEGGSGPAGAEDPSEEADGDSLEVAAGGWRVEPVGAARSAGGATVRTLPGPSLGLFDPLPPRGLEGWTARWVEVDSRRPFVVERSLGRGRLVVVADARVVTNDRLDRRDAAPFVLDQVAASGVPWVDEHAHGVVPESGTIRYLAGSPAAPAGLGLVAWGALLVWRGRAWPSRRVDEVDPAAPTLAAFVDSVARLYARSGDHARIYERYRRVCLERIRRALGLAPGTPAEIVAASLRARGDGWPALLETGLRELVTPRATPRDAAGLVRSAERLDALVRVVKARGRAGRVDASVAQGASTPRASPVPAAADREHAAGPETGRGRRGA